MTSTEVKNHLERFEDAIWRTDSSRAVEAALRQLRIIKANIKLNEADLKTFGLLEKRLVEFLLFAPSRGQAFLKSLPFLSAKKFIGRFR
jgi:ribosomal protein S4